MALPIHFHDEDQITFVLSGRRRFVVGSGVRTIEVGRGVLLPARSVHRSLAEQGSVTCLNLYVRAGKYDSAALMRDAENSWSKTGRLDHDDLSLIVGAHRSGWRDLPPVSSGGSVTKRAERAGLSREEFSRAFRRQHGMPPYAFELMARLNDARRLLRYGEAIAAVASDAGFVDQSHLGRCFRRVFGVTPGRYREGCQRSQTYQTRR